MKDDKTGKISIVWCIEDVQSVRAHLDDDQAMDVLEMVLNNHDASIGVSWDTLEYYADEYYPKPDGDILNG